MTKKKKKKRSLLVGKRNFFFFSKAPNPLPYYAPPPRITGMNNTLMSSEHSLKYVGGGLWVEKKWLNTDKGQLRVILEFRRRPVWKGGYQGECPRRPIPSSMDSSVEVAVSHLAWLGISSRAVDSD